MILDPFAAGVNPRPTLNPLALAVGRSLDHAEYSLPKASPAQGGLFTLFCT